MPKILDGVKVDDEMTEGVNGIKYSYHDVEETVKFLDFA
jgi:hypothetical protein